MRTKVGSERPEGLIQRVVTKNTRRIRWMDSRVVEKLRDRKTSSPTKRQLTVHLYKNCRVSSNARDRYPTAFAGRNGSARITYYL